MIDPTGFLKDILTGLYKGVKDRRLAVDAADRLVDQVYQAVENFVRVHQALTAWPNADPIAIVGAYHELENAIAEIERDKVLVKCIEKGREFHYTYPDRHRPAGNGLIEYDLGRALWHIDNSARRVLKSFGIPIVTGPGLSANPLSDIRESAGYFRATWDKVAPLRVERKYFGP